MYVQGYLQGSENGLSSYNWHLIRPIHIGNVMVSMLTLSVVDRGFELRSGHTEVYNIGICLPLC
jgi:hypothetical protein